MRLKPLFLRRSRQPTKHDALEALKRIGAPVGAVLDVGVKDGTPALLRAYPDRMHLLMEPVTEWNAAIAALYARHGAKHEIVNAAISSRDGDTALRLTYAGGEISHAHMVDEGGAGPGLRTVPMRTLDSVMRGRALPRPYLLKIDIDGEEMQVIRGAERTLQDCSIVIVETLVDNMAERIGVLDAAGFQVFDIVDLCYYGGRLAQADFVLLNRRTIEEHGLHIYRDGFDIRKWFDYRP
ncbi:MAG: FkbM family methyltransferase [Maricaulaceae bacterium]|nr:FkbM family methyltransferase [Maricaulaceae bacterium]